MKQKILIADDEVSVQRVLARVLGSQSYELLRVSNGRDALDVALAQSPDIILLDINMPEKNGWDVLRELRGNSQTRMIPVIMVTGFGAVSDEVGGLEMGADDYITKPFATAELKARVAAALRRNRLALAANPLTRLPGSPMIEDEVNRRIREGTPFAFLYADINHFKSYNDAYGYARGDRVIRETADMLLESLRLEGGGGFVGHIGGDDFVIITAPTQAPHLAQRVVSQFDQRTPGFYDSSDRRRGCIQVENRAGRRQRFPLITLSIGIVTTQLRMLDHYGKVVKIASEMKAYCKSIPDHQRSRFSFDRRRDMPERDRSHRRGLPPYTSNSPGYFR